jgi:hypothetical protein
MLKHSLDDSSPRETALGWLRLARSKVVLVDSLTSLQKNYNLGVNYGDQCRSLRANAWLAWHEAVADFNKSR